MAPILKAWGGVVLCYECGKQINVTFEIMDDRGPVMIKQLPDWCYWSLPCGIGPFCSEKCREQSK